jgi:hypothetical protein
MVTHVPRGTKHETAERLAGFEGEVREAIVFVEEPATAATPEGVADATDIFDEMRPFMVHADALDDSREAIYTRNGE